MKIFDENSIEKLNFYFYFYFGKFVTKNSALENNTIFLPQFFWFRGGVGNFPLPPLLRPCIIATLFWSEKMFDVKKGLTKKKFDILLQCQTSQTFFTSNYFRYTVLRKLRSYYFDVKKDFRSVRLLFSFAVLLFLILH